MKELIRPRVLVVGDVMWDTYYIGTADRISPEAPIPVVKLTGEPFCVPGGAGNVAENLKTLGAYVTLVSGVGSIEKNRLMVGDHQIARWDENDSLEPINPKQLTEWFLVDRFGGRPVWRPEAVVVADYQKGSITKEVTRAILDLNLPIFVDTKGDPSVWDQSGNGLVLFPNKKEYQQYREEYDDFETVVLKCGAEGVKKLCFGEIIESFPSQARFVRSVNGAGDTVMAAYVYADVTSRGGSWLEFANMAAGIAVEKPFTATVSKEEVLERLSGDFGLQAAA